MVAFPEVQSIHTCRKICFRAPINMAAVFERYCERHGLTYTEAMLPLFRKICEEGMLEESESSVKGFTNACAVAKEERTTTHW